MSEKRVNAKPAPREAELNGRSKTVPMQRLSGRPAKAVEAPSVENNRSGFSDALFYLAAMTYFFADYPGDGAGKER